MLLSEVNQKRTHEASDVVSSFPDSYPKFLRRLASQDLLTLRTEGVHDIVNSAKDILDAHVKEGVINTELLIPVPDFTIRYDDDYEEFENNDDLEGTFDVSSVNVIAGGYSPDLDILFIVVEGRVDVNALPPYFETYFHDLTGHEFRGEIYNAELYKKVESSFLRQQPVYFLYECDYFNGKVTLDFKDMLFPRSHDLQSVLAAADAETSEVVWL